jgi:hypothetical protein
MTDIQEIVKEVDKFNDSIKDALNSKNITNTGEAANSLRIDYGYDFVQSIGIFYLEFLDTGRGPGKMPPFEPIMRWAIQKTGQQREELYALVRYVQNKIANLGTEIFLNSSKGIELSEKILTLKENLNDTIKKSVVLEIKQKLNEFKIAFSKKYSL